jgi:hypothetical protein
MSRAISDMKHELAEGADPREWMQVHPWATMGVAAVAGFLAASMLVPSEEEQALKRLAAIEKALTPHLPRNGDAATNGDSASKVASGKKSFLSGLAGQVIHAIQPALMSAITAGVTAKSVGPDNPDASAPPPAGDMPSV